MDPIPIPIPKLASADMIPAVTAIMEKLVTANETTMVEPTMVESTPDDTSMTDIVSEIVPAEASTAPPQETLAPFPAVDEDDNNDDDDASAALPFHNTAIEEVPTEEVPTDLTDASIPPPPPLSTSLSSASSSISSSPPTPPPSMGPSFHTWSTSSDYEARVYEHPSGDDECYASPYPIVVMTKHRGFLWNEEMFVTARRYKAAAAAQAESTGGEEGIRREEVVEIKLEEWECNIWPA